MAETIRAHTTATKKALFSAWCTSRNITTNGVDYQQLPNHGFGIVAQRRIEAGEELVNVPSSALLTVESIPEAFRTQHKPISVHGLLASFLASGSSIEIYGPWSSTWPNVSEFREAMPLCWPQHGATALTERLLTEATLNEGEYSHLPPAIERLEIGARGPASKKPRTSGLLVTQRKKLRADWEIVSGIFPDTTFENYLHKWLVVNTRSLYHEMPTARTLPPREDHMVLCPFIDLFNHSDSGCAVHDGPNGFTVTSNKAYEAGDEIYVSYGPHSNDFLLVEYGFLLDSNRWDSISVDHILMGYLVNTPAEQQLQQAGYLGDYAVTRDGPCWRTEVAVRTQTLREDDWGLFVQGFDVNVVDDKRNAEAFIRSQLLEPFCWAADRHIERSQHLVGCCPDGRRTITERWKQIRMLLKHTAELLRASNGSRESIS